MNSPSNKADDQSGFTIPVILSFTIAAVMLLGSLMQLILTNVNVVGDNIQSQKAFNIAEAGINY